LHRSQASKYFGVDFGDQMNRENNLHDNVTSLDERGKGRPVPTEIDARIYMAAERTFLAWIRTGIALMGFGFVVARFGLFLRELTLAGTHQHFPSADFSMPIGIGLIAFGILLNIVSVVRHRRYITAIDRNDFRSAFSSSFAIWVAFLLAIVGIVMTTFLVML
jgi:putative membrane protein